MNSIVTANSLRPNARLLWPRKSSGRMTKCSKFNRNHSRLQPTKENEVKTAIAASLLALIGTTAQAEIMCTQHRGCWETGLRIFRDGGVNRQTVIINRRDGQKDSGKPIRIRCNGSECR